MISILCPTRLRPEALRLSLSSLQSKASGELEFLLAVDHDDPTDYSVFGAYSAFEARVTKMDRVGYAQLHEYYNLLAGQANGRWVMIWNDDALMTTPGWDQIVASYDASVVLSPDQVHRPLCTFPIIPRRFVSAIGHVSLNAHCDTWWEEIAREIEILEWPPIHVDHRRADVCGENRDSVFAERDYQTEAFDSMKEHRHFDAMKIKEILTSEAVPYA